MLQARNVSEAIKLPLYRAGDSIARPLGCGDGISVDEKEEGQRRDEHEVSMRVLGMEGPRPAIPRR